MSGEVEAIFIAPEAGEDMQKVKCVRALAGKGLEGDRYFKEAGTFSKTKKETVRHISLISIEAIDAANLELAGKDKFKPKETRRNIVTSGINLNQLVGRKFLVGDALVRGVEPCAPCQRPAKLAGKPDFKNAFEGRGGLRAEVLKGGIICPGSSIVIVE